MHSQIGTKPKTSGNSDFRPYGIKVLTRGDGIVVLQLCLPRIVRRSQNYNILIYWLYKRYN